MFVGREREIAALHRVWAEVRRGSTRVVGVSGAQGVGKTALVRHFLDRAEASSVLWASGDEAEAGLPWGVLSQLELPVAVDGQVEAVFVAHALADRLRANGETVLVIDDAQWADPVSMAAIRLAARRLPGGSVLLVVIHQGELDDGWRRLLDSDRGVRLELAGLPPADLVRFAVACGHPGLSPAGAARLHEHTGGHPLHVRHLLDELPMHAIVFGHGALPAPKGFGAALRTRVAACRPSTQDLLGAAAVLGRRFSLAQLRQLGVDTGAAVTEAIGARLLTEVPGSMGQDLEFTGTLARGLVYHDLDRARRRELHARAARAGGDGALWHRIAAADGLDPLLAKDIEDAAGECMAQGRLLLAAAHLRHALDLTPPGPDRRRRLLTAVEALLVVGDLGTAARYQGEVAAGSGAWADYVAGYQLLLTGQVAEAKTRLARALAVAGRDRWEPPDLVARVATQLALIAVLAAAYEETVRYGDLAVAAAREPWVAGMAWFTRSIGLALTGRAADALARLSDVDGPGAPSGLDGLVARGMIRLWTDDLDGARRDLSTAVERATRGETLRIAQALGFLGEVEYRRGALAEAVVHTELAVGDAEENNRVWDYAMLHALACYPLAARGEWRRAEAHAAAATSWARKVGAPSGIAYAAVARAAIAAARGDAAQLLAAAEDLESIYPRHEPGTALCGPLRADALSRLGRVEAATAALNAFTATVSGRQSAELAVARVRAQIAAAQGKHGDAIAECRRAHGIAETVGLTLEAARVELLAGCCEAAAGRRAAAERTLRSALRRFIRLGAAAYVTLTRRFAEEAGLSLDAPPATLGALTPAERAVVSLVRQGLSNRQVAQRLVLSTKTVEFHLTNVYRRLDVSSRDELRRVIEEAGQGGGTEIPGSSSEDTLGHGFLG